MKRLLFLLVLLLPALPGAAQFRTLPGLDDSETVRTFRTHVTNLAAASLEGRKAGSEGEKEAAAYVDAQMREYGLDMLTLREGDVFGITQENGDTLLSRNVVGMVQGYD
ncbi:MAG: hypothetical protein J6S66_01345, partial [Bacteroidales bacterium]|nr:hypothetical protein [Bacteroidales bacterium]